MSLESVAIISALPIGISAVRWATLGSRGSELICSWASKTCKAKVSRKWLVELERGKPEAHYLKVIDPPGRIGKSLEIVSNPLASQGLISSS